MGSSIRLHVRAFGAAAKRVGPPVVLLHGLGVSGVVWTAFARRELGDREVIAPDLRGHGESGRSPDAAYGVTDYAGDVADLVATRFGGTPVVLVGHSLGGLVAIEVARQTPAVVGHLALLDPPLDPARSRDVVATVARLRTLESDDLEEFVGGEGGVAAGRALGRLFRVADAGTYAAYLGAAPGAAGAWEAAPEIDAPTVVVQADVAADGALATEVAEEFVRRLPNGRLVQVPGAAHAVHASHPRAVGDALRALVGGWPPDGPRVAAP